MKISAVIKPIEELETFKRGELMREVLQACQSVKNFKARHKFEAALKEKNISMGFGSHKIYFSKYLPGASRALFVEIYTHEPSSNIPEILAILEKKVPRYGYQRPDLKDEAYLYNAHKDIENSLSDEMSLEWFLAYRDKLSKALIALSKEVAALDPNDYMVKS